MHAVPTQAPGAQEVSLPQPLPSAAQVCWVTVSLHFLALGGHTVQESPTQAPGEHARLLPHAPLMSHVCCVAELRHCVLPGTHTPEQRPVDALQTNGQTVPLTQVPVPSQVCGGVSDALVVGWDAHAGAIAIGEQT